MKLFATRISLVLIATLFFTACGDGGSKAEEKADDAIELQISAAVKGINDQCPMQLDDITVLDKAENLGNRTFGYYYTIDVDPTTINMDMVEGAMKEQLLQNIITRKEMKTLRDADCNFKYFYSDADGGTLFTVTITPEMYKAAAQS